MHRCLVPPSRIDGKTITIDDPAELHHLRHVLRLSVGDRLTCFDGTGREFVVVMTSSETTKVVATIEEERQQVTPSVRLWLGQSLIKMDRFEWVVEKATELGVERLSPLLTARSTLRLADTRAAVKVARWQRIATAAAKQCDRATVPTIDPPQSLKRVVELFTTARAGAGVGPNRANIKHDVVIMPTLAVTTRPLHELMAAHQRSGVDSVVILIGPEGDFTPEEVQFAQEHGAHPVSLGPLTLRSETAALATVAIVRYLLAATV